MATERQPPDAIASSTALTVSLSDLTSDPDSGDANWGVATGNNVDTDVRVTFATPTGDPTVGADLQEFKIEVRQFDGGQSGTPDARIELWENGSLVRAGSNTAVTSATSQVISFTWNASELATADGSLVECKVFGVKSGGSPSARNTVDFGGIEWNVDYVAAGADAVDVVGGQEFTHANTTAASDHPPEIIYPRRTEAATPPVAAAAAGKSGMMTLLGVQ